MSAKNVHKSCTLHSTHMVQYIPHTLQTAGSQTVTALSSRGLKSHRKMCNQCAYLTGPSLASSQGHMHPYLRFFDDAGHSPRPELHTHTHTYTRPDMSSPLPVAPSQMSILMPPLNLSVKILIQTGLEYGLSLGLHKYRGKDG